MFFHPAIFQERILRWEEVIGTGEALISQSVQFQYIYWHTVTIHTRLHIQEKKQTKLERADKRTKHTKLKLTVIKHGHQGVGTRFKLDATICEINVAIWKMVLGSVEANKDCSITETSKDELR